MYNINGMLFITHTTHTHTHSHTHTHTHSHSLTHTHTHTCTHTLSLTLTHTCMHTHTHSHTYSHTHTHTHTHTYTHILTHTQSTLASGFGTVCLSSFLFSLPSSWSSVLLSGLPLVSPSATADEVMASVWFEQDIIDHMIT